MTKSIAVVSGLIVALAGVWTVQAQVTLDISKVTCDQFARYQITNPANIIIWLNGYHSGKSGNTIVDTQELASSTETLEYYCIQNPRVPIMQAFDAQRHTGK